MSYFYLSALALNTFWSIGFPLLSYTQGEKSKYEELGLNLGPLALEATTLTIIPCFLGLSNFAA